MTRLQLLFMWHNHNACPYNPIATKQIHGYHVKFFQEIHFLKTKLYKKFKCCLDALVCDNIDEIQLIFLGERRASLFEVMMS